MVDEVVLDGAAVGAQDPEGSIPGVFSHIDELPVGRTQGVADSGQVSIGGLQPRSSQAEYGQDDPEADQQPFRGRGPAGIFRHRLPPFIRKRGLAGFPLGNVHNYFSGKNRGSLAKSYGENPPTRRESRSRALDPAGTLNSLSADLSRSKRRIQRDHLEGHSTAVSTIKPRDLNFKYSIIGFCMVLTNRKSVSAIYMQAIFSLSTVSV